MALTSVDTNIVVRLLTQDDEAQHKLSHQLFSREDIFIAASVVLETEWVLRFAYELSTIDIVKALTDLFGLPNVRVENEHVVKQALAWYATGLDFADALHLASSHKQRKLKTFDRDFMRRAKRLSGCTVEGLA